MILVIDNYDCFTYNLVQLLAALGAEVEVRAQRRAHRRARRSRSRRAGIVISPGPGTPDDAGISRDVIRAAAEAGVPLLGVCLGHQCIAEVFGGTRLPRARAGARQDRRGQPRRHGPVRGHARARSPRRATTRCASTRDSVPDVLEVAARTRPTASSWALRHRDAARLRRAVPPRERADARGHEAARELPRRRRRGAARARGESGTPAIVAAAGGAARASAGTAEVATRASRRSARVAAGASLTEDEAVRGHEPDHGRRGDAVADQRAHHRHAHEGRDRRRDRRLRPRDARARHAGAPDGHRLHRHLRHRRRRPAHLQHLDDDRVRGRRRGRAGRQARQPRGLLGGGQRGRARGARRRHRRSAPPTWRAASTRRASASCSRRRCTRRCATPGPTRREIGIRTVFNILGPLTNPAGAKRQLLGVYDPRLAPVMAEVAGRLGAERVLVVNGHPGMDEVSASGPTTVAEFDVATGGVRTYEITPESVGIARGTLADIAGGDAAENAAIVRAILGGRDRPAARRRAHERGRRAARRRQGRRPRRGRRARARVASTPAARSRRSTRSSRSASASAAAAREGAAS